jgi:heme-degrading monooxygenase HmoA
MIRIFARHKVEDYQAWRKVYDSFDEGRTQLGIKAHEVFQSVDDPNDITVLHDVESAEVGKAFIESDKLRDAMKNGGVVGTPTFWITKKV